MGHALGRTFIQKTVVKWVEANWHDFLGTVPVVVELSRGWFSFNFLETGLIQKVLA